jgi:hypothetical protein
VAVHGEHHHQLDRTTASCSWRAVDWCAEHRDGRWSKVNALTLTNAEAG